MYSQPNASPPQLSIQPTSYLGREIAFFQIESFHFRDNENYDHTQKDKKSQNKITDNARGRDVN